MILGERALPRTKGWLWCSWSEARMLECSCKDEVGFLVYMLTRSTEGLFITAMGDNAEKKAVFGSFAILEI